MDLSVKVPGGVVEVGRNYYKNTWFIGPERTELADPTKPAIELTDKGLLKNGIQYYPSNDDVYLIMHYKIT